MAISGEDKQAFCENLGQTSSMDPYQELGVIYNAQDDTLTRLKPYPSITTETHNSLPNQSVFTQDFALNTAHKTSLRLYKPIHPPPNTKLPLILYIHGGGFFEYSASGTVFHDFCTSMATALAVVILSLDYRLAPESRLPAAYEDGVEALVWIKDLEDSTDHEKHVWKDTVDFSKCYIMGTSSGGNVAYHVGLRGLCLDLEPMVVKGYIFHQPFFGREQRSESELRLGGNDSDIPSVLTDIMWELSLPKGCNRHHEYCNPLVGGSYSDKIGSLGRCFLSGCSGDLLLDYQKEFGKMLEKNGVDVVCWFEQGYHAVELFEADKAQALFLVLRDFISS